MAVGVGELVGAGCVSVTVAVGGASVAVPEAGRSVGVALGPDVKAAVDVGLGARVTQLPLPASVKVCPAIGTNSQS